MFASLWMRKGISIEDKLEHRMLGAYAILLIGSWTIDMSLDPKTPAAIRTITSGFKWIVTGPFVVALAAGVIGLVGYLAMGISRTRSSGADREVLDQPPQRSNQQEIEERRMEQLKIEKEQKRFQEEQMRERRRQEVEAAEVARARFHKVKQTRSADDAAKTALEEF